LVVVATTPWPQVTRPALTGSQSARRNDLSYDPRWQVRTIDCGVAANFYGDRLFQCRRPTLLPWGFTQGPSDTFLFYRIDER
jgi:hypothetical protein